MLDLIDPLDLERLLDLVDLSDIIDLVDLLDLVNLVDQPDSTCQLDAMRTTCVLDILSLMRLTRPFFMSAYDVMLSIPLECTWVLHCDIVSLDRRLEHLKHASFFFVSLSELCNLSTFQPDLQNKHVL